MDESGKKKENIYKAAFDNLRDIIKRNETLYMCYLVFTFSVFVFFFVDAFFFLWVSANISKGGNCVSFSGFTALFFKFLNIRTKIGLHDILVAKFSQAPPPPLIFLMEK